MRKLQQHANVLRRPPASSLPTDPSLDGTTSRVSLYRPLDTTPGPRTDQSSGNSRDLCLPRWMELLPSRRNPYVKPPPHSVFQRRRTFPYFESTRYSTPFSTPPEYPRLDRQNRQSIQVPSFELPSPPVHQQSPTLPWKRDPTSSHGLRACKTLRRPTQIPELQRTPRPKPAIFQPVSLPVRNRQTTTPSPPSPSTCQSTRHSPLPSQEIIPTPARSSTINRPPFLKELSGFLASRAGKWVLPSRMGQAQGQGQRPSYADDYVHSDGLRRRNSRK